MATHSDKTFAGHAAMDDARFAVFFGTSVRVSSDIFSPCNISDYQLIVNMQA